MMMISKRLKAFYQLQIKKQAVKMACFFINELSIKYFQALLQENLDCNLLR